MRLSLLILLAICFSDVYAQQVLPKELTDHEKVILDSYFSNYSSSRGFTTPPGGNLRCAAEWEEVQSLVITWTGQFNVIQRQIVEAAQQECEVLIACDDSLSVQSYLTSNGVSLTNLSFLEVDFNSIWIRDYAANTIYRDDVDSLILVDWIYNRPRPDDDAMPEAHANFKGIPLYETTAGPTDIVNTGGNWMSDGFGTAFASELIVEENGPTGVFNVTVKNEGQIDSTINDFMGIDRYIKMPVLPYDNIHHIDMHMKLLDEETLLVSKYPAGVADGPQIEANIQYVLSNYNSVFGTPYKVKWITVPPSTGGLYPDNGGYYRTYSNNVMVNKTVIVPIYREEYDTTALRTLQEALPGYKIVGIDVDNAGQNLIQYSGAIHCITHTIGVDDPLLISHQALEDTYNTTSPYSVKAYMNHKSGISSATLYWTADTTAGYSAIPMSAIATDSFAADIPVQTVDTEIFYYVEGHAVSGKQQVRPITAPEGYWSFEVFGGANITDHATNGVGLGDVYPNPASAITCIPVTSLHNTEARICLRDVTGKLVDEIHNGSLPMGESKYFLFANLYPAGSYLIVIESGESVITKKLMIR